MEIRQCQSHEEDASWAVERQVWPPFNWEAEGCVGVDYDPDMHMIAIDDEEIIATIDGQPMEWDGRPESLPRGGWTELVLRAQEGFVERPKWAFAVGASILPGERGKGLAEGLLTALRDQALGNGYAGLVAPVRPTGWRRMPHLTIAEYAQVRLPSGEHVDPWVRIHERIGGRLIGWCSRSAVFGGTREQWEVWGKMRLPNSGAALVDGAQGWLEIDNDGYGLLSEDSLWLVHGPEADSILAEAVTKASAHS